MAKEKPIEVDGKIQETLSKTTLKVAFGNVSCIFPSTSIGFSFAIFFLCC
jgi:hypothetical protein